MAKLAPIFRQIARDVALGCSLEDIAALRDISLEDLKKVTRGGTFSKAVSEIQKAIDLQVIEEAAEDPIRRKLKVASMNAANRLVDEVNNFDKEQGANASTRIKAASTVLDISGYTKQENTAPLAVIMLSPGKLELIKNASPDSLLLKDVPDLVDGMPS